MNLASLIFFCLSVIGLSQILIDSDMPLIVWFRNTTKKLLSLIPGGNWAKVLECYQCCGTWCGFLCGFLFLRHAFCIPYFSTFEGSCIIVLLSGFAGSYLAQLGILYNENLQAQALGNLQDIGN